MADTFGITITADMKHGILYAAAKRLGSNKALAEELGIYESTIGQWIKLKKYPHKHFKRAQGNYEKLEAKLLEVTGKLIDELWPQELRNVIDKNLIRKKIEIHKEIPLNRLTYAMESRILLPSPEDLLARQEIPDVLNKLLHCIKQKYRIIISMRYLEGLTLEEIANKLNISRERVRQVEVKGLRLLYSHAENLNIDVNEIISIINKTPECNNRLIIDNTTGEFSYAKET